jgi:hypothetical protein
MLLTVRKVGRIDNLSERGAHLGTPLFYGFICRIPKFFLPCSLKRLTSYDYDKNE